MVRYLKKRRLWIKTTFCSRWLKPRKNARPELSRGRIFFSLPTLRKRRDSRIRKLQPQWKGDAD